MAPRTSWKGFLRLSLISVPVKAYTAHDTSGEVRLNQLHKECHARVRYKKVCPEHGELSSDDIVSGYEYAKDSYVVIDPAELDKLRPASDRSVRIQGFVPGETIDPITHAGRAYYLLPDGAAGDKPYALLRQGMLDAGVVALAQVVISGREQLVMVHPEDELLAMTVLQVAARIKDAQEFKDEIEEQQLTKEELALTKTLIDASILQDFDYASLKDGYTERLKELIRLKVDGKEVVAAPDTEEPRILNLMDALKRSVAEAQAEGGERKLAASVKSRKGGRGKTAKGGGKRKTG
jgi:DNA end-binding protein Ku